MSIKEKNADGHRGMKYKTKLKNKKTMRINCIATGSSGNLYEILDSKGNSMLLEAGVPRDKFIKYRVGVTPPEMLMITHSHGDHSFYRAQYSSICNVIKYKDFAISSNFSSDRFPSKAWQSR